MYAVVEYNDYHKDQCFEVIMTTDDIEYAKKAAFQRAKKNIPKARRSTCYKITTKITDNNYLRPTNKQIISYRIIDVGTYKNGFKIIGYDSNIYAVIEINPIVENIEQIDTSLICNDYYEYDDNNGDNDD